MEKQEREQFFKEEYVEYLDRMLIPPEELGLILIPQPKGVKERLAEEIQMKDNFLEATVLCKEEEAWFVNMTLEEFDKEIKLLRNKVYRLENPEGDGKLEKAKNIPIDAVADMLGIKLYKSSSNRMVCTIREEKHPSCTLYLDNNTYYDFGIGYGGDTVSFYMKATGCDFKEALNKLV